MLEGIKRSAAITAVVLSATFSFHCGGDGPTSDAGSGGDAGVHGDGGSGGMDSGTGGDGGTSLCDMYPDGSPNRVTFGRGEIKVPAQNTSGWLIFFRKLEDLGGTLHTTFGVYPDSLSSPPTYYGFDLGQTKGVNVPTVGTVNMQLCDRTSTPCAAGTPGGSGTGDANCRATLAADRPWGN